MRLWLRAGPDERDQLFTSGAAERVAGWIDQVAEEDAELAARLADVAGVLAPARASAAALGDACEAVMRWAVLAGLRQTAIEYAEIVATCLPASSAHAATAGRLNRGAADHARATQWFRRAIRLARIAESETDFAIAHLGLGNLEFQRGRYAPAERHLLKAMRAARRNGNVGLQAAAHHELLNVEHDRSQLAAAIAHAETAMTLYPRGHPSIPHLVFDTARVLSALNHHSLANYLYAAVIPWFDLHQHRILAYAALAYSTGAARDRFRFERCSAVVLDLVDRNDPNAARGLFRVAAGATAFEDWDRATDLAARALAGAKAIGDQGLENETVALLERIRRREVQACDELPPTGGIIEQLAAAGLAKLRTLPPPASSATASSFPQYFPLR
ncbi:MAG TPA: hypothetical protein VFH27_13360 [Longimicrobiaceae bacterium]|nr:hypothetical protein [Longimicrobiaceae bacterium]